MADGVLHSLSRIFEFLKGTVETFLVLWLLSIPLLAFRRFRYFFGCWYLAGSYVAVPTLWVFATLICFVTLGTFWAVCGMITGPGILVIATIGALIGKRWVVLSDLVLGVAFILVPRVAGLWLIGKYEEPPE